MGSDPLSVTTMPIAAGGAALQGGIQGVVNGVVGEKPSMPGSPDYKGAAEATAAGNLANAQAATAANRPNQYSDYGSSVWTQTGKDEQGNPIWENRQSLSPEQKKIFDQQTQLSQGMLGAAQQGMGAINDIMSNPTIDQSKLAQFGINPGQNYTDAMMQQMQPNLDRQQNQLNQQLANQGIPLGSEAYKAAQDQMASNINNQRAQAVTQGMGVGLQANQQGFQQALMNKQLPLNLITALRGQSQVRDPSFMNLNASQATTPGPDYMGAAAAQGQFDQGMYNSRMGERNSMIGGLFSLGGGALAGMSDRRAKENIQKIGTLKSGLGLYSYSYKPEFKEIAGYGEHIGVMADEVELLNPMAIIMHPTGYKMVNYSLIG